MEEPFDISELDFGEELEFTDQEEPFAVNTSNPDVLLVTVEVAEGKFYDLKVRENDDITKVANDFALAHNLDERLQAALTEHIHSSKPALGNTSRDLRDMLDVDSCDLSNYEAQSTIINKPHMRPILDILKCSDVDIDVEYTPRINERSR
jgi:hypothetical protein